MAKIIGFSSSPTKGGVMETALTKVLEAANMEWELIRLSKQNIKYCSGCVGCASTNKCVYSDDMEKLLEKFMDADAVVFGSITRHNGVNAIMKNFMERFFPLYHRNILSKNKKIAIVSTGLYSASTAYKELSDFARSFGMEELGHIITGGNASCYKCGFGKTCKQSAHVTINGADTEITDDTFYRFINDDECTTKAVALGQKISSFIS